MKILITGAEGFVGKNVRWHLEQNGFCDLVLFDVSTPAEVLDEAACNCDFILHFAGVNRPENESEFMEGNFGFTSELLSKLRAANNRAPILITSSIQAALDNPYGRSKKAAEDYLFEYSKQSGAPVYVYRLPNVFGKWCRPNYNSAIATFCHNIARGLPIKVNDPSVNMRLVHIDDLAEEILNALRGKPTRGDGVEVPENFCMVSKIHRAKLGEIVDMLKSFERSRSNLELPNVAKGSLSEKLYGTYLSYLPEENFAYPLKMNEDARGSFTEFLRTPERGQVSVNVTKVGVVKGNHWHHLKNEKFLVVKGKAAIRFRRIGRGEITEYIVSGDRLEVVDIPCGYTHNIENIGEEDLVTIMWASEPFDPEKPDTYFEKV